MKHVLMVLTFCLITLASHPHVGAQAPTQQNIILKGRIFDKKTNQPLAYVSVGVINKSLGTVSDKDGYFAFSVGQENLSDSLQISIVGYKTLRMAVKDIDPSLEKRIELSERVVELAEVTVSTPRTTIRKIGRQGSGKLLQVSVHHKTSAYETIGSEMGMLYKNDKQNAFLKDFNFYISANNFNFIKFRVNVYAIKNDLPDTLLCSQQIFATVDHFKTGWTTINLEPYNIMVNSDFILTIQWLESKMDKKERPITILPVAMTPFSKNCYIRIASQDKWKRMGMSLSSFVTIAY